MSAFQAGSKADTYEATSELTEFSYDGNIVYKNWKIAISFWSKSIVINWYIFFWTKSSSKGSLTCKTSITDNF